eukprot:scaffold112750_cov17-Tisochrysis_lutea.AAC.1
MELAGAITINRDKATPNLSLPPKERQLLRAQGFPPSGRTLLDKEPKSRLVTYYWHLDWSSPSMETAPQVPELPSRQASPPWPGRLQIVGA